MYGSIVWQYACNSQTNSFIENSIEAGILLGGNATHMFMVPSKSWFLPNSRPCGEVAVDP